MSYYKEQFCFIQTKPEVIGSNVSLSNLSILLFVYAPTQSFMRGPV